MNAWALPLQPWFPMYKEEPRFLLAAVGSCPFLPCIRTGTLASPHLIVYTFKLNKNILSIQNIIIVKCIYYFKMVKKLV